MLDGRTQQLVLDGKALRGIHGEQLPGVRLVAVYAPEAGLGLAQAGGRTHEEQAQTEEERAIRPNRRPSSALPPGCYARSGRCWRAAW